MSAIAPGLTEAGVRRFPIGLTAAAAVCLAVLIGLGVWQMKRLAWKQDLLARIARLEHAAPRPLPEVLAHAAHGADVSFTRVETTCGTVAGPSPSIYRYALHAGQVGWRLMGACRLAGGGSIVIDRGLVDRFAGGMAPTAAVFPPAGDVVGVLRSPGAHSILETAPHRTADGSVALVAIDPTTLKLIAGPDAAPDYIAVEKENPPPPGITPAALPQDIPNNHFVYALTWFGVAGVLIWMWAAFVIRRMRGQ